jgi:hypothetical protein
VAPPVPRDLPSEIRWSRSQNSYVHRTTRSDGTPSESHIEYVGHHQWRFTSTPTYWLNTEEYYFDPRPEPYRLVVYQPSRPATPAASQSSLPVSPTPAITQNPLPALLVTPAPATPPTLPPTAPSNPPPPPMATKSSFKVDKPSSFDGTKSKYDAWKVECQLFFIAHEKDIDSDGKKIVSTLSYMKGGLAEKWKTRFVTKDMVISGYVHDYAAFTASLDKAFTESNKEQKAMDALARIQQGKRTADEYTAEFRVLLSDSNISSDRAAIRFYQDGLNIPLVDRIYGVYPLPDTLDKWVDHAIQFDTQWRDRQAQKKGKTSTAWHGDNKKAKDPDAMDIDRRQN